MRKISRNKLIGLQFYTRTDPELIYTITKYLDEDRIEIQWDKITKKEQIAWIITDCIQLIKDEE